MLSDKEKDRLNNFKIGHVCPDRHAHDGMKFSTQVFNSNAGIGKNIYIKCNRCHTWQDITDYEAW